MIEDICGRHGYVAHIRVFLTQQCKMMKEWMHVWWKIEAHSLLARV